MTAHARKDCRRRGVTSDVLKGDDAPLFHGVVISHLYSDLNLNRDNAVVFWQDEDDPAVKLPVLEIDILKSKVGSFRGVIYELFDPRRCLIAEADDINQALFRGMVYSK